MAHRRGRLVGAHVMRHESHGRLRLEQRLHAFCMAAGDVNEMNGVEIDIAELDRSLKLWRCRHRAIELTRRHGRHQKTRERSEAFFDETIVGCRGIARGRSELNLGARAEKSLPRNGGFRRIKIALGEQHESAKGSLHQS